MKTQVFSSQCSQRNAIVGSNIADNQFLGHEENAVTHVIYFQIMAWSNPSHSQLFNNHGHTFLYPDPKYNKEFAGTIFIYIQIFIYFTYIYRRLGTSSYLILKSFNNISP